MKTLRMKKQNAIDVLRQDYCRYTADRWSFINLIRNKRHIPGLDYMVWFRLASILKNNLLLNRICEHFLHRKGIRYGFDIPSDTNIGGGFCIKHHGMLIINRQCVIGENCTVVCGTVIGKKHGENPVIGNCVEIGANVSVIGGVTVGDGAKIGAGSVVVHDVEPMTVVAGNPAHLMARK